jgi:hypothetical protein
MSDGPPRFVAGIINITQGILGGKSQEPGAPVERADRNTIDPIGQKAAAKAAQEEAARAAVIKHERQLLQVRLLANRGLLPPKRKDCEREDLAGSLFDKALGKAPYEKAIEARQERRELLSGKQNEVESPRALSDSSSKSNENPEVTTSERKATTSRSHTK